MKTEIKNAIKYTSKIIDVWIPLKIKYDRVPGISIGLAYKGNLVYKKGFGFADVLKGKKATEKTLYRLASISKVFTSVVILQLTEQGKLAIDDFVIKYIPWFKGENKEGDLKNVTIRQILSHTSGIFRDGEKSPWEEDNFPKKLQGTISNKSVIFENSMQFKYSNHAFSILGEVIKKVSGLTYEKYIYKNILEPLKLKNTYPDFNNEILGQLAIGYGRIVPDCERETFKHVKTFAYAPTTGFISNIIDLTKFISLFTLSKSEKTKVLGREFKKEMMRSHSKSTESGDEYGLGLDIYNVFKRKVVGHSGSFSGYTTAAYIDPSEEFSVVVLSNALESSATSIAESIFEMFYYFIDNEKSYETNKSIMKKYEGIYRSRWNDISIVSVGGKLIAFNPDVNFPLGDRRTILSPKTTDAFVIESKDYYDSIGEIVQFKSFKNKKAQELIWGSALYQRVC